MSFRTTRTHNDRTANSTYPKGGVSFFKDSYWLKSRPSVSCKTLASEAQKPAGKSAILFRLQRIQHSGHFGDVKFVGQGVFELLSAGTSGGHLIWQNRH